LARIVNQQGSIIAALFCFTARPPLLDNGGLAVFILKTLPQLTFLTTSRARAL